VNRALGHANLVDSTQRPELSEKSPAKHISKMPSAECRYSGFSTYPQALDLAGELAAQRAAAVPVSLAASKWPGGDAADHGGGDADGGVGESSGAVAQRQESSDTAALARQDLPNGSAPEAQTGVTGGLPEKQSWPPFLIAQYLHGLSSFGQDAEVSRNLM
jgi:hypothetical protein